MQIQFSSADVEETAELPQLQLVEFWTVVACPLCATTGAVVVDVLAQFIDDCGRPCDHPVTFVATVEVPQIQFIAGSWWTFQLATETGTRLSAVVVMAAAMKGFVGSSCVVAAVFALLRVVPEWSASFWSPR